METNCLKPDLLQLELPYVENCGLIKIRKEKLELVILQNSVLVQ